MSTPVDAFLELCTRFDAGDTTVALANEIEGLVLDSFDDEPWAAELVYVLSLYQPGGQRPYADEDDLRRELAVARGSFGSRDAASVGSAAEVQVRTAGADDLPFLAEMLGEAAVWRPDKPTPTGDEVLADPRFSMYLDGWPRAGDVGVIAEQQGPLGAAWFRTFSEAHCGHGFVARDVPELSIAVIAPRRRQGIGRLLLVRLIDASEAAGHPALSLSVNLGNPARQLYESVGFEPIGPPRETALTMIRRASR